MAMNSFIQNEVIRKAKAGEQLAQSTPEKMALYNQHAKPKPTYTNQVQPTKNWASQIQSPQFGYGNTTQKVGYTDKNAEIQRTQNVLNQRQQAGMDNKDQLSHYRNLTGKDYTFNSPSQPVQNTNVYTPKSSPTLRTNRSDGNGWFIDNTGTGRLINTNEILGSAGSMQQAIANAQRAGNDALLRKHTDNYSRYTQQMKEQGIDLSSYGDDLTTYSQYKGNNNLGMSGYWNQALKEGQFGNATNLMQRDLGIGNQVDLTFNRWDNKDDVLSQLNSAATAVSSLSRDNNVTQEEIQDIYNHYLKLSARANELGYEGVVSPLYQTGFVDPYDSRYNGFVDPSKRGFMGGGSIQEQYAKYLKKSPYEQLIDAQLRQLLGGA